MQRWRRRLCEEILYNSKKSLIVAFFAEIFMIGEIKRKREVKKRGDEQWSDINGPGRFVAISAKYHATHWVVSRYIYI